MYHRQIRSLLFVPLLLLACDSNESEFAQDEEVNDDDSSVIRSSVTDNISSCKWERVSNGSNLVVDCDAGQRAISGGCRTGTGGQLTDMHPYEGSVAGNLIEYGEYWYAVFAVGGWRCQWDAASADNYVIALCCGT
jgi:hypothetical protein